MQNQAVLQQDIITHIRLLVQSFVNEQISFNDAMNVSYSLTGNTQPIQRLKVILDTPPEPLPDPSDGREQVGARKRSKTWNMQEDQRLLAAIHHYGTESWTSVSRFVGNGRTKSQCSQRWARTLDPRICKGEWTRQEEEQLVRLVTTYGEKSWTTVASLIGNRTDVQCRYRYMQLKRGPAAENQESRVDPQIPLTPLIVSEPITNFHKRQGDGKKQIMNIRASYTQPNPLPQPPEPPALGNGSRNFNPSLYSVF